MSVAEVRKLFTPHELLSYIMDPEQKKILGFGDPKEAESLMKAKW